jgi:hypothetical protein
VNSAGAGYIPEGPQSLGVYEGSFSGDRYGGSVRIHLYQTPQGTQLFEGDFKGDTLEVSLYIRAKIADSNLEGTFQGIASRKVTGQISSDGNALSGSYDLEIPGPDNGT